MAPCPKLLGRFVRALGRCALLGVCLLLSGALERRAAAEPIRPACSWLLGVTQGGGSGLFDLPLADPGCPWQLRLGAWGSGFLQYNFLLVDDRNEQISGAVQLGATLGPYIEAWLQIGSRANRNQRPATETSLSLQPTLALGRTAFGLKLHTPWGRLGHVAVQPLVRVHSGPFDFGPSFSSIDAGIDLLGSLDLSPIWPRLPLRLSGRVGYLHDRSDTLLASLDCMAQGSAECLATRLVYTTAYDVGQPRVELGLGADAHFRIGTGLYLGPAVSYRLAVVTGDGDPVLRAQLAMQGGSVSAEDIDARVAQMLTIGARMRLPWPVSIDLGMQIALSGWGYAMGPKLPQLSGYGALSFAIDVGSGQMHPRVLADPRVVNLEQTDARDLTPALIPEAPQLIVCDASFIGLAKVLPTALSLAAPDADLVTLVKPQFEASGPGGTKKGVVRDATAQRAALAAVAGWLEGGGWAVQATAESPITGGDGNVEFLLWARRSGI